MFHTYIFNYFYFIETYNYYIILLLRLCCVINLVHPIRIFFTTDNLGITVIRFGAKLEITSNNISLIVLMINKINNLQ
jgi:hypothetical protein